MTCNPLTHLRAWAAWIKGECARASQARSRHMAALAQQHHASWGRRYVYLPQGGMGTRTCLVRGVEFEVLERFVDRRWFSTSYSVVYQVVGTHAAYEVPVPRLEYARRPPGTKVTLETYSLTEGRSWFIIPTQP